MRAASISQTCLPTPEKTTLFSAGLWALRTRSSSPPETMSKPAPCFAEEAEDGERGVGFDGVADGVGTGRLKARCEELEALRDLVGGVDVERGAVLFGEGGEADSVAVERAVAVDEGAGIREGDAIFFGNTQVLFAWQRL